jgi:hypothetical protein
MLSRFTKHRDPDGPSVEYECSVLRTRKVDQIQELLVKHATTLAYLLITTLEYYIMYENSVLVAPKLVHVGKV